MTFIITREMELSRARLEAYKNTIQPYPALPKEETPPYQGEDIGYRQLNDRFDRWMGMVVKLQKDINKYVDLKKERESHLYE